MFWSTSDIEDAGPLFCLIVRLPHFTRLKFNHNCAFNKPAKTVENPIRSEILLGVVAASIPSYVRILSLRHMNAYINADSAHFRYVRFRATRHRVSLIAPISASG